MSALREIFASFGVEFDKEGRLTRGNRSVEQMTTSLRNIGAVIGGSMLVSGMRRFVGDTLQVADDLDKTAQQIGLTTREFQAYAHAASLAGVDSRALLTSIGMVQQKAYLAAQGSAEAGRAFRLLGINIRDSNGNLLSGSQLMEAVAEGLHNTENTSLRTALSMQLLGEQGRRLLPMFSRGAEGIRSMRAELDSLGGGVSQQFIDSAVHLNDNITRLKVAWLSLKSALMFHLLPIFDRVVQAVTRVSAYFARNQSAIDALKRAFKSLGAVAAAAAAVTLIKWALASAPLLLAALAAAVLYLAFDELWVTLKGGDSILRRYINEQFPGVINGLDGTDRAIMRVIRELSMLWTRLQGFTAVIIGMYTGIRDFFVGWAGMWRAAFAIVRNVVDRVVDAIVGGVRAALDAISPILDQLRERLLEPFLTFLSRVGSWVLDVRQRIMDGIGGVWTQIAVKAFPVVQAIGEAIERYMLQPVRDFLNLIGFSFFNTEQGRNLGISSRQMTGTATGQGRAAAVVREGEAMMRNPAAQRQTAELVARMTPTHIRKAQEAAAIDARQTVTVNVTEAQDPAATEASVRRVIREENDRQVRQISATLATSGAAG